MRARKVVRRGRTQELASDPSIGSLSFDAVAHALEPLAHAYLRAGLGAGEFLVSVKYAFIKAAANVSTADGKLNISAIAVSTGLTRKETKTILDSSRGQASPISKHSGRQRSARVVQGWRADPTFLDRFGQPAKLTMRGSSASFEALVRRYGGDVTPVSVLTELQRNGVVSRRKDGAITLRSAQSGNRDYEREAIGHVAVQLRDLAATLVSNVQRNDHPIFTGFREAKSLPPDIAAVFIKTFTERSAMLLDSVEQWFALQHRPRQSFKPGGQSSHRVGIGVYLVDEPAGSRKPMPPRRRHQRKPKELPPAS